MHGNGLHQNGLGKASRCWDVPITVSRRSFIRFTFWMDQELAMLEARWRGGSLGKRLRSDKRRLNSSNRLV